MSEDGARERDCGRRTRGREEQGEGNEGQEDKEEEQGGEETNALASIWSEGTHSSYINQKARLVISFDEGRMAEDGKRYARMRMRGRRLQESAA